MPCQVRDSTKFQSRQSTRQPLQAICPPGDKILQLRHLRHLSILPSQTFNPSAYLLAAQSLLALTGHQHNPVKMPAPAGAKRVRGIQIHRPFIYGTEAIPFDPANRPKDAPPDHTHKWKVFVRGINNEDISCWLRRVQFKLHDTYANSVRMLDGPPFEVEETGWGEFEIAIKFYFAPESNEKPQQIWHGLKLHPYQGDVEKQKVERTMVSAVCYEEVVFSEPLDIFYDVLTGGGQQAVKGKAGKGKAGQTKVNTAEIPERSFGSNKFSREEESKELDRLGEAVRKVESMVAEEKQSLVEEEKRLAELEKTEGKPIKKK